jgi:hypothetical protein
MVGIRGPHADAQNIHVMNLILDFLESKLKLNLNKEKNFNYSLSSTEG